MRHILAIVNRNSRAYVHYQYLRNGTSVKNDGCVRLVFFDYRSGLAQYSWPVKCPCQFSRRALARSMLCCSNRGLQ